MLTVVLCTRDRVPSLVRTLDALEATTAPAGGHRVIIVDMGSRDDTSARLAARAPRLGWTLLGGASAGANVGRNRALAAIEGDLVVFTDDDTIPRADWLVNLRATADAHPEADVIVGTVVPRFEAPVPDWLLGSVPRGPAFAWVEREADGPVDPTEAVGPCFAVRSSRFAEGLRFDETIGPDGTVGYAMGSETELLLRIRRAGARAWYARSVRVEHAVTSEQLREGSLVRRAFRLGRGQWRLEISRMCRKRLRLRGLPVALLVDLLFLRRRHAKAERRGDAAGSLRAAWRSAYLAGHVDEVRSARGLELGLGRLRSWLAPAVRDVVAPRQA